jgi:ATP-dependent protease ClpP protease subunit
MPENMVELRINEEKFQAPSTRLHLYDEITGNFNEVPIVCFFTSFVYPATLEDKDAEVLEDVLRTMDLKKGLILVLSSPGGYGLTAERIIKICRAYSGTGTYKVIVPGKAKSAATMICLGADEIIMGETSELGPIDPQIVYTVDENSEQRFSADAIIKSFEELFSEAIKTKGRIEPFLQQLNIYDYREIEEMRREVGLSEDIAIKALKSGYMKKISTARIKRNIKIFVDPKTVKTHGRPICYEEVRKTGLNATLIKHDDKKWNSVYELYARLNRVVSSDYTG